MKNKRVGLVILSVTVLLSVFFAYFRIELEKSYLEDLISDEGQCLHTGDECPFEKVNNLLWPTVIASILILFLFLISLILIFYEPKALKPKIISEKGNLSKDESLILKIIEDSEGSIFQSTLVEKSKLSKVKVTRILDRLEGKQIIERKRRGMTNMVLLKQ